MSREDAQMKIRLPADLKEKLEKSAVENKRSMNAEVLHRLNSSFVSYEEGVKAYDAARKKMLEVRPDLLEDWNLALKKNKSYMLENQRLIRELAKRLQIELNLEDDSTEPDTGGKS